MGTLDIYYINKCLRMIIYNWVKMEILENNGGKIVILPNSDESLFLYQTIMLISNYSKQKSPSQKSLN